eukprot:scaffold7387_cov408-Prasinococcus_capsulatus_cf.AAC.24
MPAHAALVLNVGSGDQVALPSTLFLAIAQLDLNSINLVVIAVMSVAKVMVFLVGAFVAAVFGSGTSANKMRITGMRLNSIRRRRPPPYDPHGTCRDVGHLFHTVERPGDWLAHREAAAE